MDEKDGQEDSREAANNELIFAREVMHVEATAIQLAAQRTDAAFLKALNLIDSCKGKLIVTGVGKSGIAARKIAATMTSIGFPAFFLHPSEAMHGDLGIVQTADVIMALSNSGESEELLAILPSFLSRNVTIIALVGNVNSTLASRANVVLDASIEREACPLDLAPTASVVVAMALGDAMAMTLLKRRNFQPEDYAFNHPGGRLGRRLTLRVGNIMRYGEDALPALGPDASFQEVLYEISAKHVGAACVIDSSGHLLGIIAESEVRMALQKRGADALSLSAASLMNSQPAVMLKSNQLAYEALLLMEERLRPISFAPVVDEENCVIGVVHVHDLVRAKL